MTVLTPIEIVMDVPTDKIFIRHIKKKNFKLNHSDNYKIVFTKSNVSIVPYQI